MRRIAATLVAVIALSAAPLSAGAPVWISASRAEPVSPLMVLSPDVRLSDADALGPFIVPIITASARRPGSDGWAQFRVEIPRAGRYRVWGRLRCPSGLGESFAVVRGDKFPLLVLGSDAQSPRSWHWARAVAEAADGAVAARDIDLPAGAWTFRIAAHRASATCFGPLNWRQAEPTFNPRLDALCLSDDPSYVPSDEDARKALGAAPGPARATATTQPTFAPPPADAQKQPIPDWMRCPRWYTKDSWREELATRHAGDIAALVKQVAANGGNALRLSVFWGGEAYYQSRVAPMTPGLGRLDYLDEAVRQGKASGVQVVAYMNPNALFAEHPLFKQCAIRDADGKIAQRPAYGWKEKNAFYACINNPRYRAFLRDVLTEIFKRYKADGLYVDGLTPHVCFCEHCRAKYRQMYNQDMPVERLGNIPVRGAVWAEFGRDPQPVGDVENDPDARRLTEMMLQSLIEVTREFRATVKAAHPEAITAFHSHPKPGCEEAYDATLTEVYSPRPWVHIAWRSGELAGYSNVYRVPVLFNVYPHTHYTAAESRYMAIQGLSAGAYPNFWSTPGMNDVFSFMARRAEYLDFSATRAVRFLALPRDLNVSPMQQKTPLAAGVKYGERDRFLAPYVGAYSAMMRSGLPVVTLQRPHFEEQLEGFEVLCLANVALMSDAQVEVVRSFVRSGGGLIATYETSLYDEKGRRRDDFALADVLGARCRGAAPAQKSALRLEADHALARGVDRPIEHDEPAVLVQPTTAKAAGWLGEGGAPAVLVNQFGKGKVVYLSGRLDSMQCYQPSPGIERLMTNVVRWVAPAGLPVEIEAPGIIGVSVYQQPHRFIVHLVNHQRDSRFKSDAFAAIEPVRLRVRVPAGARVREARRLWTDQPLAFKPGGAMVAMEVGRLEEYEVIAIEW